MMNPVSFINKPQVLNFLDTPTFQRHAFGSLIVTNGLLRPIATLRDKSASEKERRYSATRELFHQTMCFISHYSLATNFEKLAFQIAKRIPNLQKEFGEFQTFEQVKAARQFNVEARRHNRLIAAKLKSGMEKTYKNIPQKLTGILRVGDSLGTILALTCVAPLLNNFLLGPTLKLFKLSSETPATQSNSPKSISFFTPDGNQFYQANLPQRKQTGLPPTTQLSPFGSYSWGNVQTPTRF